MSRADDSAAKLVSAQGVSAPPVPVHQIAESMGATVVYQPLDGDVSGMLLRTDGKVILGVNSAHSPSRQRFTIAHELGHLLLHEGRQLFVDKTIRVDFRDGVSSLASNRQEIEANRFAAALLMPADLLREELRSVLGRGRAFDEETTSLLAERFGVSAQAMGYRLGNLGFSQTT